MVKANDEEKVIRLNLRGNLLRREIPASLGDLQQLQGLFLQENTNLVDQDDQVANALRGRGVTVEL